MNYTFRMHDPRIGRFFNEDPLTKSFPMLTPYQFASNTPMQSVDLDGLEGYKVVDHIAKTTTIIADFYYSPSSYKEKGEDAQYNNKKLSAKEVDKIVNGIYNEFNKSSHFDSLLSDKKRLLVHICI